MDSVLTGAYQVTMLGAGVLIGVIIVSIWLMFTKKTAKTDK